MNLNYSLEARLHLSAEDFKQAYLQGAKDILSLPLCERLTEEEKVKIRGFYNGETFGELDFLELISCRRILASLLGSDFFKEGGNDE